MCRFDSIQLRELVPWLGAGKESPMVQHLKSYQCTFCAGPWVPMLPIMIVVDLQHVPLVTKLYISVYTHLTTESTSDIEIQGGVQ